MASFAASLFRQPHRMKLVDEDEFGGASNDDWSPKKSLDYTLNFVNEKERDQTPISEAAGVTSATIHTEADSMMPQTSGLKFASPSLVSSTTSSSPSDYKVDDDDDDDSAPLPWFDGEDSVHSESMHSSPLNESDPSITWDPHASRASFAEEFVNDRRTSSVEFTPDGFLATSTADDDMNAFTSSAATATATATTSATTKKEGTISRKLDRTASTSSRTKSLRQQRTVEGTDSERSKSRRSLDPDFRLAPPSRTMSTRSAPGDKGKRPSVERTASTGNQHRPMLRPTASGLRRSTTARQRQSSIEDRATVKQHLADVLQKQMDSANWTEDWSTSPPAVSQASRKSLPPRMDETYTITTKPLAEEKERSTRTRKSRSSSNEGDSLSRPRRRSKSRPRGPKVEKAPQTPSQRSRSSRSSDFTMSPLSLMSEACLPFESPATVSTKESTLTSATGSGRGDSKRGMPRTASLRKERKEHRSSTSKRSSQKGLSSPTGTDKDVFGSAPDTPKSMDSKATRGGHSTRSSRTTGTTTSTKERRSRHSRELNLEAIPDGSLARDACTVPESLVALPPAPSLDDSHDVFKEKRPSKSSQKVVTDRPVLLGPSQVGARKVKGAKSSPFVRPQYDNTASLNDSGHTTMTKTNWGWEDDKWDAPSAMTKPATISEEQDSSDEEDEGGNSNSISNHDDLFPPTSFDTQGRNRFGDSKSNLETFFEATPNQTHTDSVAALHSKAGGLPFETKESTRKGKKPVGKKEKRSSKTASANTNVFDMPSTDAAGGPSLWTSPPGVADRRGKIPQHKSACELFGATTIDDPFGSSSSSPFGTHHVVVTPSSSASVGNFSDEAFPTNW